MKKKSRDISHPLHAAGLVQRASWLFVSLLRCISGCLQRFGYSLQPTAYSLLLVFSFAFTAAADVTLKVTPSRDKVYLGETFNLNIEVSGADRDAEAPDLSSLTSAEIQFLGTHSRSHSSISIINGRMSRESFEGRTFAYQVKPAAEGVFKAGPIRVKVAGNIYTHTGVSVHVSGIEKQDTVIAAVAASSTSVLVEEPFTVTLSVAVAELPDPYASNEPILPNIPPHLSADFLEVRQNLPGLKGPDLNQLLNGLIDQSGRQPCFAINDYKTRDFPGFGNMFGDDGPFKPRPFRFRLAQNPATINGKKYRQYTLSLSYTPTKEGEYTFGPAVFKGTVIADVTADRHPVTKDVYTIGPAVTVRVVPPPDEGCPEWFVGTVGKALSATAAFDATTCKVGDPLTLTLELTGAISISNLRTPLLNLQPELSKDFRIYDDNVTAETLPNGKRFSYRVRPTREGTLEFPPIKIAYYDTGKRAYDTVSTAPIPIQARATTQIATAADQESAAATGVLEGRIRPLPAGITLSAQGTRPDPLFPPPRVTRPLLLAGPALCLLTALLSPLAALLRNMRSYRRRSGALRRALRALRLAAAPDLAARAVRVYLADRLDVSGNALTPAETASLLRKRQVAETTAAACGELLARLDEAMYRPDASTSLTDTVQSLQDILAAIDASLDSSVRSKRSDLSVLLILSLLPVFPTGSQAAESARQFIWAQANAQAATASKPEDYLKAANTYNRLVADGVCNGPLFLNLGNALVMAGDGVNAAAAFARAERHLGATPETRQGLAAAIVLQTGRQQAELPWSRTAFFWHFAFPCTMRALTALCGWSLFWLGFTLRLVFRRKAEHSAARSLAETCMLTGGLIAFVFTASALMTFVQERHDKATWGARVFLSSSQTDPEDKP